MLDQRFRFLLDFFMHLFSSVAQSCPTLCDPMNHSMPGLPVHHQLPKSTQTHAHGVGDAIQPSHPLSSPSPPAPNPSQHHASVVGVRISIIFENILHIVNILICIYDNPAILLLGIYAKTLLGELVNITMSVFTAILYMTIKNRKISPM